MTQERLIRKLNGNHTKFLDNVQGDILDKTDLFTNPNPDIMKSLRTLAIACLAVSISFAANAESASLKGKIETHFKNFEGKVTTQKLTKLITGLKRLSSQEANMCFVSLADYNDCQDKASKVYIGLTKYLDDLIGKEVTVTEVRAIKPWEDEEYYSLTYKLSYVNDNPDYPTDVNFDTVDLGIQNNVIKDIIHSREWFGLTEYVKN